MECDLISMEASICSIGVNVGWECKRRGCGVERKPGGGCFRLGGQILKESSGKG
jgi:hypothetical protein